MNYLSLDIEGAELQILQNLPWDKVRTKEEKESYVFYNEGTVVYQNLCLGKVPLYKYIIDC